MPEFLDPIQCATRPAPPKKREEFAALLDYAILIGQALNRQLDDALALAGSERH